MSKKLNKKKESNNKVSSESTGEVEILSITQNEDGSADMEIDVDEKFLARYKLATGKTEVVDEEVAEWFLNTLKGMTALSLDNPSEDAKSPDEQEKPNKDES